MCLKQSTIETKKKNRYWKGKVYGKLDQYLTVTSNFPTFAMICQWKEINMTSFIIQGYAHLKRWSLNTLWGDVLPAMRNPEDFAKWTYKSSCSKNTAPLRRTWRFCVNNRSTLRVSLRSRSWDAYTLSSKETNNIT